MGGFSFDRVGFQIDGKDAYLVSGEFHYFRVPREDWRRRMDLFKAAGGNCLATYVPWLIHEPREGDIRFGDVDNRDLAAFLTEAGQAGLKVLLRPGPYQYSELDNDGLPGWLARDYPEILARNVDGKPFRDSSVSYLHPVFLEKARRYYRAFAQVARPFMMDRGGPVCMLQVDNELTGIHVWFGSLDYNADTMGFGKADGRYPAWLRAKYGDIEGVNRAYGTDWAAFEQARPIARADRRNSASCRRARDYEDFYRGTIAEYAALLRSWLREDGLTGPICHNSGNPGMNCQFPDTVAAMGEDFLLGSDHYYTLDQHWPQNNPTPQYAIRALMSCDTLRAMGMPPSVLEMPGGSPSDTPPILPEDLLACYLTNAAVGAKGVNFYVYTGGPNFPDTGSTCDVYDYNALVRADGSLNATYDSLKAYGEFMKTHAWMQRAQRKASVQVGFEWNTLRSGDCDDAMLPFAGAQAAELMESGVLYTLMCSRFSPEMKLLGEELDVSRPLIVPCPSAMSERAQGAVAAFLEKGGRAMILPVFPQADLDSRPCDILYRAAGSPDLVYGQKISPAVRVEGVGNVYGIQNGAVCRSLPEGAKALAWDGRDGRILAYETRVGLGRLIWFGGTWSMSTFPQAEMLEMCMERLGAKACVKSENRSVFTALWEGEAGRRTLFLMNLYSGAQDTEIALDGRNLGRFQLRPMEVRVVDL